MSQSTVGEDVIHWMTERWGLASYVEVLSSINSSNSLLGLRSNTGSGIGMLMFAPVLVASSSPTRVLLNNLLVGRPRRRIDLPGYRGLGDPPINFAQVAPTVPVDPSLVAKMQFVSYR
jgi:hypothetical protein